MNNKTAIQYIREIKAILTSSDSIAQFFCSTIEALQEREKKWAGEEVLIGMIGVTSAGKSSVLNAMIGEKILPVRVKPSSGVLVWCTKSEKREVQIKFHNSAPKVLTGNKLMPENIAAYADETLNPGNNKLVDTIDVYHPKFIFNKGITVIDSPGLDAEGHDQHEVETLVRLLPLLDICILVIPTKPNSDKMFVEYIAKAVNAKKPIIIIENMKDAVEGVKNADGSVRDTKEKVLEQHIKRINRNLQDAGIDPSKVNVLQVSAVQAMNSRLFDDDSLFMESGFHELKELIEKFIADRRPVMNRSRLFSLSQYLESRVIEEDSKTKSFQLKSDQQKKTYPSSAKLKEKSDELVTKLSSIENSFQKALDRLNKSLEKVDGLSKSDVEGAEDLITKFRNKLLSIEEEICVEITCAENILAPLLENLSMSLADYKAVNVNETEYPDQIPEIATSTKKTKSVKQTGFLGGLKRALTFGLAGYDDIEYTEYELKYGEIKKILNELYTRHMHRFQSLIKKWCESRKSASSDIIRELQRYKADFEKRQSEAAREKEILEVFEKLKNITNQICHELYDINIKETEEKIKTKKTAASSTFQTMEIDRPTSLLYSLSQRLIKNQLNITLNTIPFVNQTKHIIVAGWNEETLSSFVNRFFNISFESNDLGPGTTGFADINLKSRRVQLINLRTCETSLQVELAEQIKQGDLPVILLLNIQQFGSTLSQISRSEFVGVISHNKHSIIPVMESIEEGRNSHSLLEFVVAFDDIIQHLITRDFEISGTLVNNTNPVFSRLLNESYKKMEMSTNQRLQLIEKVLSENQVFIKDKAARQAVHEFSMGLRNLSKE